MSREKKEVAQWRVDPKRVGFDFHCGNWGTYVETQIKPEERRAIKECIDNAFEEVRAERDKEIVEWVGEHTSQLNHFAPTVYTDDLITFINQD